MLKNAILFLSSPPFLDLQGFLMVVLLSMSCLSFGSKITSVATYDVTSYGAKGDGNTDDSSVNNIFKFWIKIYWCIMQIKERKNQLTFFYVRSLLQAFLRAWDDLCGDMSPEPTLIIPSDKTFLINPVAFNGPCKSQNVNIKVKWTVIYLFIWGYDVNS